MIKNLNLVIVFFLLLKINVHAQISRPKIVVGIVVDQMRWDYLYRFHDRYSKNGFKRLLTDGFEAKSTYIHYTPTFTAPGHATIYTGSSPAFHGIVANDWIENNTHQEMYCTQDDAVTPIGSQNKKAGSMSPKNMLASTMTDELRLATNFRSKTYGISLKDRGSILPAGHSANGAFWFDEKTGTFISSSYYMKQLPKWLVDFNSKFNAQYYLTQPWQTLYDIKTYTQSTTDDNSYEGTLKKEKSPIFPHVSSPLDFGEVRKRPEGNTYTLDAAKALIEGENLGKSLHTDFLAISLSSTDYIGHIFAPNSIEIEDTYLRLDNDLASFLKYLDAKFGIGNYTIFLTADHGGAHNPRFLNDHNMPGSSNFEFAKVDTLNKIVAHATGITNLIIESTNYQLYLNKEVKLSDSLKKVATQTIFDFLYSQPTVSHVIDFRNIDASLIPNDIKGRLIQGYRAQRSGDIQIVLNPGSFAGYLPTGTTHGSWNPYDSRIPLIFYGFGIKKGSSHKKYFMNDIAPTICALLNIQEPNACTGNVIAEALSK